MPSAPPSPLHVRSPLNYSPILSAKAGCNVYLKLENAQPSGSFKTRGVGFLAQRSLEAYGDRTHLICSSGGNAGLACAYAAWSLGVKSTICVPLTTKESMIDRLRSYGTEVIQGGAHWAEADRTARLLVSETEGGQYVPPFDHPLVVEGNSSIVFELKEQLEAHGVTDLAGIVCSVGGGGLLAGILRGLAETGLKTPVIACETQGAASLALSLSHAWASDNLPPPGEAEILALDSISSIASSLGSTKVSRECLDRALAHEFRGGVVSVVMQDELCVSSIRTFADDHAFLVEPACAASIAPLYKPAVLRAALPSTSFALRGKAAPSIVVIVCGGNAMSQATLELWEAEFAGRDQGKVLVTSSRGQVTV